MKDFDFQIKKNQEDITAITNKVESLSKDLDDLVSLYEIVSEQMNPFVGLSKVTKKRLDALENIIKEVDGVKTKLGDFEALVEKNNKNNNNIKTSPPPKPPVQPGKKQELSMQSTTITQTPKQPPVIAHSTIIEQFNETELDNCLTASLESLLLEQNIDAVINEFFINLK